MGLVGKKIKKPEYHQRSTRTASRGLGMRINKITYGFVIQTWDTDQRQWVKQAFVAADQTEYEHAGSDRILDPVDIWPESPEPHLPFLMTQPDEIKNTNGPPVQNVLA